MNPRETALIIAAVKNLCPAQKFDEFTPDMWLAVLAETNFEDAKAAVIALGRQQTFLAPGEIDTEARRMRRGRIERLPMPCPNTIRGVAEGDELRAIAKAIGDGRITTVAECAAYERWGGSLHLAQQAGRFPELSGPEPVNRGAILAGPERRSGHPTSVGAVMQRVPRGQ